MNTGIPHAEKVSETERVRLGSPADSRQAGQGQSPGRAQNLGVVLVRSRGDGDGATAERERRGVRVAETDARG